MNTRAALLAVALVATPAHGVDLDAVFQKHGTTHGVDWRLLKAIATVESHLNPRAENPDGLSAGIMQIHCVSVRKGASGQSLARAPRLDPIGDGGCRNRFDIAAWPPATRAQLYDPDYNIALGAEILAWNIRHYGLHRGIAAYNQWSARLTPRGQVFPNQYYVDKVLREYRALSDTTRPAGGGAGNTRSTGRPELLLTPPPVTVPPGPRNVAVVFYSLRRIYGHSLLRSGDGQRRSGADRVPRQVRRRSVRIDRELHKTSRLVVAETVRWMQSRVHGSVPGSGEHGACDWRTMKTIGQMIQQIGGLAGTRDVNDWENEFIKGMVELTENGKRTSFLSAKQVDAIESIYRKHFA